ncbi:MAG: [citrate (pro-3S)-lyase] ligase, partial [Ruminococcaceae bacterium]|nr:[citrate (pro-3S)-lyase] ligase [Oscillospiraceae bacterium]
MYIETVSKLKGSKKKKWQELLSTTELHDDRMPDSVVLVWDDDDLIATGSREKNILKYLSVSPNRQGEDLLSVVLTNLRKDAFENGYNHLFLYTKPSNKFIFTSLFFYPIVETDKVLFMENKQSGISDFISKLPVSNANEINGAIVMNCNPFTLGHQYLIESAAASCDRIFI